MDIKDLHCFIAAFDAGSSKGARKAAGTTQSNISRRIRSLERFLGVMLFTRVPHGLVPTPHGEKLYPLAETVLSAVLKIEEKFDVHRPKRN